MILSSAFSAAAIVAADKPLNEDTVRPGLIGLFFFVALFVATYFLWRSMNKQMKKVDAHFADDPELRGQTAQERIAEGQRADQAAAREVDPTEPNHTDSNGTQPGGEA